METKTEARTAKKEDLARYLIDKGMALTEEASREEILEMVLRKMEEGLQEGEKETPPEKDEEPKAEETNLKDDLELLSAAGFSTKEQVSAFLKGLGREKEEQVKRKQELEDYEKVIEGKIEELRKKESHIESKGEEVMKKLVEQKELFTKNYELQKKLNDIGLKS